MKTQHPQRKTKILKNPRRKFSPKIQKCLHTPQQPPEEIPSKHPAQLTFILNPPSATREVFASRSGIFPTQFIARNIHTQNNKNKTTNHLRILCLFTRIPHHPRHKTKTSTRLLVSFTYPPFPTDNSPRKKNKPGYTEVIPDTPASLESPRVALGSLTDRLKAHKTDGDVVNLGAKKPGLCPVSNVQ